MRKITIIFILLCYNFSFSQTQISLKTALEKVSKSNNVQFSFSNKIIESSNAVTYNSNDDLELILSNLSLQSLLIFEKLEDNYYLIRKPIHKFRTLCGVILNSETKKPIRGVVLNSNTVQTITNKKGEFKFSEIGSEGFLTIKSLGYKTKIIALNTLNKDCINIYLEESINNLSEIVITSYLSNGISKKNNGSIIMKPNKLGVLPGLIDADVLQSMQLIPGVQSPDETATGLHIRGSTPDQNLVIFDGMKMYHTSHFFGLISAFNPYVTENIQLYRSGTQAKYGNNVGGVLDISTQNSIPNKISGGVGVNFTDADLFFKTPLFNNKVGLVFSGRRSITDIISTPTYDIFSSTVFQNSRISNGLDDSHFRYDDVSNNFFYADYNVKLIGELTKKSKLTFSHLYNTNDLLYKAFTIRTNEDFLDKILINNTAYHLDWRYQLTENTYQKTSVNKSFYSKDYDGVRNVTINKDEIQTSVFEKKNTVSDFNIEYFIKTILNKKSTIQLGYQFSYNEVFYDFKRELPQNSPNDSLLDVIENKGANQAFFADYKYSLTKKWLINLGLRWQQFDVVNKGYAEPRFYTSYKVNPNLRFKFSTELKHQSISQVTDFREDGLGSLFNEFWALSNTTNIPVLESIQNSLGFVFHKNSWSIDAEIYYKDIDGILYVFDEITNRDKYHSGNNTVYGLDLLIKKSYGDYNTWLSYTLSKSNYAFSSLNNGDNFDGDFDTPHTLIWSHNYKYKGFEASLGWRFRNGIPYTEKFAETGNNGDLTVGYNDFNGKRLPNYQRVDLSASYSFLFDQKNKIKGKIGVSLLNILNKKNILSRDYEIETIEVQSKLERESSSNNQNLVEIDRLSLGFVPNVVFRVSF